MGRLLDFFLRYGNFLIFMGLQVLSLVLLVNFNQNQEKIFDNWLLDMNGSINQTKAEWQEFIGLTQKNEELALENIRLKNDIIRLRNENESLRFRVPYSRNFVVMPDSLFPLSRYEFKHCRAISNEIRGNYNFITLNVGKRHGVRKEMGIMSSLGIAGIVVAVSENYSLGMSLLNKNMKLSAKILSKNIYGTFNWHGGNPYQGTVNFIPLHFKINVGDTIVTSGYSAIFPENFVIGTIAAIDPNNQDGFYDIKVKLATDFSTLDHLYLVQHERKTELDSLRNQFNVVKK